jgi:uncharacterized protein (DUF305 family)
MTASTDSGATAQAAAPEDVPAAATSRRAPLWVLAALIVGLLLGTGIGLVLPHLRTPGDDSAEAGFLRDMSTHHAQAIDMAMTAHAGSDNPQIVTLAADIATVQQAQVGYMQAWLRGWHLDPTGTKPPMSWMPDGAASVVDGLMPGMATPAQLDSLHKATGKQLDIQFLTLMRQHHLGGIHMAQEILNRSKNEDIDWLAGSMVSAQQGEILVIDNLLKQIQAG